MYVFLNLERIVIVCQNMHYLSLHILLVKLQGVSRGMGTQVLMRSETSWPSMAAGGSQDILGQATECSNAWAWELHCLSLNNGATSPSSTTEDK